MSRQSARPVDKHGRCVNEWELAAVDLGIYFAHEQLTNSIVYSVRE